MKAMVLLGIVLAGITTLVSCSGQSAKTSGDLTSSSGVAANASASGLDQGPRAGEAPITEGLVDRGEQLFKDKGCSACHTFGRKLTGPDLHGVTQRRTARWIENQILHPEVMTKQDPISRGLFAQFSLQMPNQGLTAAEAQAVIEYFKHQDHEAGESKD
jgi:mono/diheme cytochrome c family protein